MFAVLTPLGGLVQINPVWLYDPYEPTAVTSPAQPDRHLGWLEGALRLYPPWEGRVFGHEIPKVFVPACCSRGSRSRSSMPGRFWSGR